MRALGWLLLVGCKAPPHELPAPPPRPAVPRAALPPPAASPVRAPADAVPARHRLTAAEGALTVGALAHVAIGSRRTAAITVTPGAGYQINLDLRPDLVLAPPVGIAVAPELATWSATRLAMTIAVTATQPGNYTLEGTLHFAVCRGTECAAKDEPIALPVQVE